MTDFNILVGGEAGQGVQSIGIIIARTMARGGYHIFADQDYESRVRGGHNFFRIRISDTKVQAVTEKLDLLLALNQETVDLHQKELNAGSIIIHDAGTTPSPPIKKKVLDIPLNKIARDSAEIATLRERWLARHPKAALYIDFGDFNFYRLALERAFLNGGFGKAYVLEPSGLGKKS